MHDNDDHKALYQNCEMYDPLDRDSGPRVGPILT